MARKVYLYHGSDVVVPKPSLLYGGYAHDFGQAFYLTSDPFQAYNWAKHKVKRNNYEATPKTSVFELDINKVESLKILKFESASKKWLDYIAKNRNSKSFALDAQYDLVIGPVVDGYRSWYNISEYYKNKITFEKVVKMLRVERLTDQWAFKTELSLKALTFKGVETYGQ